MISYKYSHQLIEAWQHHRAWATLVEVRACLLFGAKALPIPMLPYCQLDPKEWISVDILIKIWIFLPWKCIWKSHLPHDIHFVHASMYIFYFKSLKLTASWANALILAYHIFLSVEMTSDWSLQVNLYLRILIITCRSTKSDCVIQWGSMIIQPNTACYLHKMSQKNISEFVLTTGT